MAQRRTPRTRGLAAAPGRRTGLAVGAAAALVVVMAALVGWLIVGFKDTSRRGSETPTAAAAVGGTPTAEASPTAIAEATGTPAAETSPTAEASGTEAAPESPTVTSAPAPTPTPTAAAGEFGELPSADMPSGSASSRLALTYHLDMSLQQIPAQAAVYQIQSRTWTADQVRRLAQSLGVDGDVVDQGGGSFRVSGSGSLYVSGDLVQYVAAPRGTPTGGKLPADDDLVQTARSWLLNHNLAGADIGPGSVIGRREDLGRAVVVVKPVEPSPILSETPSASVTVTASGAVAEATIRWPAALKKATYGLRGPEDLWSDASNGRGYVDIDPSQLPPGNGQVKGTVTITSADLAYTTAGAAGTRRYLVPIVAFKGQARIEGVSGPIPVTIYVQAVGAQAAPRG